MRTIPCATAITLTAEERAALEALVRSRKTDSRMRDRARIVLLAADGVATCEIGRIVGCTTGTASKWRVRFARARLAGLDETGNRGAAPKYGPAEQKRSLAMLGRPPPFAVLEVATGKVTGRHDKRRRRVEFLDFMNRVVPDYPDRDIHVVLDNLSTHKPKRDLWLAPDCGGARPVGLSKIPQLSNDAGRD